MPSASAKHSKYSITTARLLWLLSMVLLLVWGCSTPVPGPGVNRAQLFPNTQQIVLPFNVIVGEESEKIEQGTLLVTDRPTAFEAKVLSHVVDVDKLRRDSKMRETFLAGMAFAGSVRRLSYQGSEKVPSLHIELVHCLPVEDVGLALFLGTRHSMHLLFNAWFDGSNKGTQSMYRFDYKMDSSYDKKDILREMMDRAINHWAEELMIHSKNHPGLAEFPSPRYGDFAAGDVKCYYQLFSLFIRDVPTQMTPPERQDR